MLNGIDIYIYTPVHEARNVCYGYIVTKHRLQDEMLAMCKPEDIPSYSPAGDIVHNRISLEDQHRRSVCHPYAPKPISNGKTSARSDVGPMAKLKLRLTCWANLIIASW